MNKNILTLKTVSSIVSKHINQVEQQRYFTLNLYFLLVEHENFSDVRFKRDQIY